VIILDTNVVWEPMKPHGNPVVTEWLDRQVAETLYLTATSLSELLVGVQLMPKGKRRETLAASLSTLVGRLFGPRVLPFDEQAAVAYASIVAGARAKGHVISVGDGQIAAIAEAHGFAIATRDVVPFRAVGVPVINPWGSERID
jgi:toxin FitB